MFLSYVDGTTGTSTKSGPRMADAVPHVHTVLVHMTGEGGEHCSGIICHLADILIVITFLH